MSTCTNIWVLKPGNDSKYSSLYKYTSVSIILCYIFLFFLFSSVFLRLIHFITHLGLLSTHLFLCTCCIEICYSICRTSPLFFLYHLSHTLHRSSSLFILLFSTVPEHTSTTYSESSPSHKRLHPYQQKMSLILTKIAEQIVIPLIWLCSQKNGKFLFQKLMGKLNFDTKYRLMCAVSLIFIIVCCIARQKNSG